MRDVGGRGGVRRESGIYAAQLPQELLPFSASAGRDVAGAPPTRGVWAAGAILRATTPTKALAGWVCTVGGTPGTWEAFGLA